MELIFYLSSMLLLSPLAMADGLYSKSSPVLQVDGRSYEKLIAKSNYTSMVEFYAPWCGHCKNLKPAYEKAASSLSGYAKLAAVNCDDDSNKAFCGSMGVSGFPTLKLVKPKKKGGKPIVEDYQGARTAKAIKEAVADKMPNHVTKVTDKNLEQWLSQGDKPKAIFFTEKAPISALVKAIAIDYLGVMDVAQIQSTQTKAVSRFMVEEFPKVFFMGSAEHVPNQYTGDMKKAPLIDFFTEIGALTPNPEFPSAKSKDSKSSKDSKDSKDAGSCPAGKGKSNKKKGAPGMGKPTKVPKPDAASETLQDNSNPTESPDPNVAAESPAPVQLPVEPAPELTVLESETALQKACLNDKSGTCVLAVHSSGVDKEDSGLTVLSEIAHKHSQRGAKLFPIYAVPESNAAGQSLVSALGVKDASTPVTLLAVNAKRGWWSQFAGEAITLTAVETWVDNIRFGDFEKKTLPDGVVQAAEEKAQEEEKIQEEEESGESEELEEAEETGHDEL